MQIKSIVLSCMLLWGTLQADAQKKYSLQDSLDHKFDLSDFVINANGFIPIPYIITEPALGGFGLAIAPIFLKKNPPIIDSIKGERKVTPVAPNITGGAVMYTVNNSWMVGGFRSGMFLKSRIKYRAAAGYGSINMSFYRTIANEGEKEFKFNFKILPISLQAIKRIRTSNWYAGFNYLFLNTEVSLKDGDLPDFVKNKEKNSLVSQLGVTCEFDNRDNVFTPDNGIKFHVDAICSDNILGSDYDFWRLNYYVYSYKKLSEKLIGGLRIDGQQVINDAPFYMLPYIDMRGIPAVRYQGNADLLSEAEFRYDFVKRWSITLFGGAGKAFDEWSDFGSSEWVYSYGTGFRYLIARKFKLRCGIDIARGPEEWAYYIVFGSNWLK